MFGVENAVLFSKGHRSLIYKGKYKGKYVCVKVAREDSKAVDVIKKEVKWLKILNKKGIGPKLLFSKKNYFVYWFVNGVFFVDYIKKGKNVKKIVKEIFRQLRILDNLKIDKKEMHNPVKHIFIDKDRVVMIDFERCHYVDKAKNLTQFCQFLMRDGIYGVIVKFDKEELRLLLKEYKNNQSNVNYRRILSFLDL